MGLLAKLFGIEMWGLSINKAIRCPEEWDEATRSVLEREIVEAMCGGPQFVPWVVVRRRSRPNPVASSLLNAASTGDGSALGTEILGSVMYRYQGRLVTEYTARNKTTGVTYKFFFTQ